MAYNSAYRWKQNPNMLGAPALNIRNMITAVPSGSQEVVPLTNPEIVGTEFFIELNKIKVSFLLKKPSSSRVITSLSFLVNYDTTCLINPALALTVAGATGTLTPTAGGATITCSFTHQDIIAFEIRHVVFSL